MSQRRIRILLVAATLTVGLEVAADWKGAYRRGRDAFAAKRWNDVVAAMQEAIGERGEERSGTGFLGRRYTPRYFLGAAQAELGDCRAAIETFEESERLGAIQETIEIRDQNLRKEACAAKLATFEQASASARAAIAEAADAGEPLVDLAQSLGAAWTAGETSLASLQARAEDLVRQAQQRLAEAQERQSTDLAAEAQQLAVAAGVRFRDTVFEARGQRENLTYRRTADAVSSLRDSLAGAERSLRAVGDLEPFPPELGRRAATLEQTIKVVRARVDASSGAEASDLIEQLAKAQQELDAAAQRPPSSLLDAASRYLSGDFAGTLEALETARFRERRAREHVCLLRAAAAWNLNRLNTVAPPATAGESPDADATDDTSSARDSGLARDGSTPREGAAEPRGAPGQAATAALGAALAGCRELESAPTPDPRFFSPRFVEFFTSALAPSAGGEAGEGAQAAAESTP